MYGRETDVVKYVLNCHVFHIRLYKEERIDGSNSGVKWSCPNIHDLMNILRKLEIDQILDDVVDKRLSRLEDLLAVQLHEECVCHNLDKKGKKVALLNILY